MQHFCEKTKDGTQAVYIGDRKVGGRLGLYSRKIVTVQIINDLVNSLLLHSAIVNCSVGT